MQLLQPYADIVLIQVWARPNSGQAAQQLLNFTVQASSTSTFGSGVTCASGLAPTGATGGQRFDVPCPAIYGTPIAYVTVTRPTTAAQRTAFLAAISTAEIRVLRNGECGPG